MLQYVSVMFQITLLFCLILRTLSAASPTPLKHKDVHCPLPKPFSLVRPSSFTVTSYVRKRQKPSRTSTTTGTLSPGTTVPIPNDHDFTQPWVKHNSAFIAFDAYAQDTVIASKKTASSSIPWGNNTLTATLEYSDHQNYSFILRDDTTTLMERQRSTHEVKLLDSRPIGLYTVHNTEDAIIGWCILQNSQLIFAFPYKGEDGRLRVFSYHIQCAHPGPIRTEATKHGTIWSYAKVKSQVPVIFGEFSDTYMDLWGYKTMRVLTTRPATTFTIPAVYRLTLPSKNVQPSLKETAPPQEMKDWPNEALQTWSPVRLFLTSLIYNLQTFRGQILCTIPQKLWDYTSNKDIKCLQEFAKGKDIQELVRFEVDLLKTYLPDTQINLDSLLFVQPPSLKTEKSGAPSRIMVLLDAA